MAQVRVNIPTEALEKLRVAAAKDYRTLPQMLQAIIRKWYDENILDERRK